MVIPMSIPKIIHSIWIQGNPPPKYQPHIKSWIRNNPEYEFIVWDEKRFKEEILMDRVERRKQILSTEIMEYYETLTKAAIKSDIIRIYLLKKYGGVYVDMDMFCMQSIDELIGEIDHPLMCRMLFESSVLSKLVKGVDIFFIMSPKNHPVWDDLMIIIHEMLTYKLVEYPVAMAFVQLYNDKKLSKLYKLALCPSDMFVRSFDDITKSTLAVHEFHATWMEGFSGSFFEFVRDSKYVDLMFVIILLVVLICIIAPIIVICSRKNISNSILINKSRQLNKSR